MRHAPGSADCRREMPADTQTATSARGCIAGNSAAVASREETAFAKLSGTDGDASGRRGFTETATLSCSVNDDGRPSTLCDAAAFILSDDEPRDAPGHGSATSVEFDLQKMRSAQEGSSFGGCARAKFSREPRGILYWWFTIGTNVAGRGFVSDGRCIAETYLGAAPENEMCPPTNPITFFLCTGKGSNPNEFSLPFAFVREKTFWHFEVQSGFGGNSVDFKI